MDILFVLNVIFVFSILFILIIIFLGSYYIRKRKNNKNESSMVNELNSKYRLLYELIVNSKIISINYNSVIRKTNNKYLGGFEINFIKKYGSNGVDRKYSLILRCEHTNHTFNIFKRKNQTEGFINFTAYSFLNTHNEHFDTMFFEGFNYTFFNLIVGKFIMPDIKKTDNKLYENFKNTITERNNIFEKIINNK